MGGSCQGIDKQAGLCSQKITIQSACSGIRIARSWRRRTDFFDGWPPCSSRNLNILKHLIGPWAVRAWHTLTSLNQYMRTHNRYTSYFINSWFIIAGTEMTIMYNCHIDSILLLFISFVALLWRTEEPLDLCSGAIGLLCICFACSAPTPLLMLVPLVWIDPLRKQILMKRDN